MIALKHKWISMLINALMLTAAPCHPSMPGGRPQVLRFVMDAIRRNHHRPLDNVRLGQEAQRHRDVTQNRRRNARSWEQNRSSTSHYRARTQAQCIKIEETKRKRNLRSSRLAFIGASKRSKGTNHRRWAYPGYVCVRIQAHKPASLINLPIKIIII